MTINNLESNLNLKYAIMKLNSGDNTGKIDCCSGNNRVLGAAMS